MQDIVAQYPSLIEKLKAESLELPSNVEFEPGFSARVGDEHFYLHTRVTLPLKDLDHGIGFGLWVEVDKATYEYYLEVVDVDEKYKAFSAEGFLANEWPGFPETEGLKVRIRTVRVEEKIYITEVLEQPADIALEMALQMSPADTHQKELLLKMIMAYING